ncbi:hypothetical protein AB0L97_22710 [Nocardia sp. NPDC051911]|uniref:hypothetical protein n=1 Tax=Nocardia sp. NPDC051911 TaxID=3154648 RepID=UPI00344407BA
MMPRKRYGHDLLIGKPNNEFDGRGFTAGFGISTGYSPEEATSHPTSGSLVTPLCTLYAPGPLLWGWLECRSTP